jgi:hypothetical protein
MKSNSTASLNYTAAKQQHKWCSFHRVKTHDTSECRINKPSTGNSKSNFSNIDSHSRINQFQQNKSHHQPFSSPNSKDNSFSNSFGQRKNWFKRKHQLNEKHQNIVEIDNQQQSCVNNNQIQQTLTETNKPTDFNRIMNEIFNEFKDFEEHYFDDSTVHTNDLDQHIDHLEAIFTKLRQVNLKLNFDKCLFVQKEIKLFGHLIGNNCIKMDHKKVELIKNWPVPTNTSE